MFQENTVKGYTLYIADYYIDKTYFYIHIITIFEYIINKVP